MLFSISTCILCTKNKHFLLCLGTDFTHISQGHFIGFGVTIRSIHNKNDAHPVVFADCTLTNVRNYSLKSSIRSRNFKTWMLLTNLFYKKFFTIIVNLFSEFQNMDAIGKCVVISCYRDWKLLTNIHSRLIAAKRLPLICSFHEGSISEFVYVVFHVYINTKLSPNFLHVYLSKGGWFSALTVWMCMRVRQMSVCIHNWMFPSHAYWS